MTRFAIGDIHGGSKTFLSLIRQINPRHDDRVYLLGDYIDRGPDSKGVLESIISMQEAGCDVRPLLGNHEDMLLRAVTGNHDTFSWCWLEGWGTHTLRSFGIRFVSELPDRYTNFLASLQLYYKDQDYLLVHASLDMTKDDPLTETAPAQMLWGETSYLKEPCDVKGTILVTGHNMRPLNDIRHSCRSSHIHLDNGAFTNKRCEYGNLVALNMDTLHLFVQPWIDGEAAW